MFDYHGVMPSDLPRVYTVDEFAELSANERSQVVRAAIATSWDDVDPVFARQLHEMASEENEKLRVKRAG